ncbi:MAG: hypothetical protein WCI56_08605 [Hyphomicrobiales bacterium]
MSIDRIFLIFALVAGAACGLVLVEIPAAREFRLPPYFWVILAIAAFEGVAYFRGRGAPGTVIAVETRFIGFGIAIALMIAIPAIAGVQIRYF